jgi:hypothetical protein
METGVCFKKTAKNLSGPCLHDSRREAGNPACRGVASTKAGLPRLRAKSNDESQTGLSASRQDCLRHFIFVIFAPARRIIRLRHESATPARSIVFGDPAQSIESPQGI